MKTKFRTKAKSALKRSAELTIKDLSKEDIIKYSSELATLYHNVEKKQDFNLGVLDIRTYADLKESLNERFIMRTYWLNNKIVGFMTALLNHHELDAHFVGLDYDFNRDYAVYQRILYDYVDLAIKMKAHKLNFGRTSGEIKSTLGALPHQLNCYLKHRSSITNHIIKPMVRNIKPTEFELRQPFKTLMAQES